MIDLNPPVLALDLATRTGWAVQALGTIASGVVTFEQPAATKSRPKAHPGQQYLEASRWFHKKFAELQPSIICYEEVYRWMSSSAAHAYGAYRGAMLSQAALLAIPCIGYTPTEIKKALTGKGTAKKPAMMAAIRKLYPGIKLIDDNQADALAILRFHLNHK